jgi:hypothetical protein
MNILHKKRFSSKQNISFLVIIGGHSQILTFLKAILSISLFLEHIFKKNGLH